MSDLSLYSDFIDPIILGLISQEHFSLLDSLVLYRDHNIESFLSDKLNSEEYVSLEVKLLNQFYTRSNPYSIHTEIKGVNFDIPLYEEKGKDIKIPFVCKKEIKDDNDDDENTYIHFPMSYIGSINLLDSPSSFSQPKGVIHNFFENLFKYNSFCFYKKIHFFLFTNLNKEKCILASCLTLEKVLSVPFINKIREQKKEEKKRNSENHLWTEDTNTLKELLKHIYRKNTAECLYTSQLIDNFYQELQEANKLTENFREELNKKTEYEWKHYERQSSRYQEKRRIEEENEDQAWKKFDKEYLPKLLDLYQKLPYLITGKDSDAWIYQHKLSEKIWEHKIDFSDLTNEFL